MMMVTNPIENWTQMAGATELQQRLNALITERMIHHQEVPADECLAEAEMLEERTGDEQAIRDFLVGAFATTSPDDGNEIIGKFVPTCEKLAKEILLVQEGQWPPVVESTPA